MNNEILGIAIPLTLGLTTILQTQLMKKMGESYSLLWAAIINNITGLVLVSLAIYFSQQKSLELSNFKPIYLFAGLFGIIFITGAPLGVEKAGPAKFFILLVASQVVFGMIWQGINDPLILTPARFIGAALVIAGSLLVL